MKWVDAFMSIFQPQQSPTVEEILEREIPVADPLENTRPIPQGELRDYLETISRRYKPHSHEVDIEIVAPWLEVRDPGDGKLHDTDSCHCVRCCVAYRTRYQVMCSMMDGVTKQLREIKDQVQTLIDAGIKTDRKSLQTAREDLEYGPGAWMSPAEHELRRMLAFAYSGSHLYGDDGELHDSRFPFPIDYMRNSIDQIRTQIHNRGMATLMKHQP